MEDENQLNWKVRQIYLCLLFDALSDKGVYGYFPYQFHSNEQFMRSLRFPTKGNDTNKRFVEMTITC